MIGQTIAHYRILDKLGAGGMGEVYLAEDTKLQRQVALKFLPDMLRRDSQARERLLREARAASRLSHANIMTVYAIEDVDSQDFIAMEHLLGQTLRTLCSGRQLSVEEAVHIATEIAAGLAVAHQQGIIHRDIKPENIMISPDGHAKIMDFGIAKAMGTPTTAERQSLTGTMAYMSPEQLRGGHVDHRTDLWSLGVILYEMLSGARPFAGDHDATLGYAIVNEPYAPVSAAREGLPPSLDRVIALVLTKHPEDRVQDALALTRALSSALDKPQEPRAASVSFPSLAVLPFVNMSPDPENEYFSAGLSEELINVLSRISGLRVVSRTSAFKFKDHHEDIRRIGELLNVQHVLEGSVRRAGQHLRVTAQLINVADGFHLWSDRFDREMDDVFVVQDEISKVIADTLKVQLTGEQKSQLVKPPTDNLEAYHTYLKGRYYWNRRTREGIAKGIQLFSEAITLDPDYALAHAGLADAYNLLSVYANVPPHDTFPKAKAAATRALAIDPTLAEAHTSLAFARCWYDWEWAEAERGFRRAIELNPNYPLAHYWYSFQLMAVGRMEEAETRVRYALDRDPLSLIINTSLGWILHNSGRRSEAIEQFIKTIELDPAFARVRWSLGLAYSEQDRFDEAIEELREGVRCSAGSTYVLAALGHVYGRAGRIDEARQVLEHMTEFAGTQYVSPADFAIVHVGLTEHERAIDALQRAVDDHASDVVIWVRSSRVFELLQKDPRYASVLLRMGLVP